MKTIFKNVKHRQDYLSFAFDYESNEVIANTEKGSAHISFIFKVKD